MCFVLRGEKTSNLIAPITQKKKKDMTPNFYILKENNIEVIKHYVEPEAEELREAKNQIKWGMEKGIINLINPIRTSTTYWEI